MRNLFLLLLLFVFTVSCSEKKPFLVVDLQVEHLKAPLGIDNPNPRFSWKLDQNTFTTQKSFRIYVAEDSVSVLKRQGTLWNMEGMTNEAFLVYAGKELQPFTKYYWGVEITDVNKVKSEMTISHFETGMMHTANWKGQWITDTTDIHLKPAPYFRKEIHPTKKVTSARAYISAAGLYEFYINGKKIGNHRLDPVYTRFDKRNLYVTYDVTNDFQQENIALGVLLGNGWYNHQSTAVWRFHEAGWRARPRFCLNVRVTYDDGSTETYATDETWKTNLSPVVFNSIYTAEHYNAQNEQPGWNTAGYNDTSWKNAIMVNAPSQNITAQALPPIRDVETLPFVSVNKLNDRHYVFDFGRNISGVTELKVQGAENTNIFVIHAEQLNKDGSTDLSNIDVHYRPTDTLDPFQTDIYTLKGTGTETLRPKFNYKGFQYVEVKSDKPIEIGPEGITAKFMHTDVMPAGEIQSSNEVLNRIWAAANASYLSNLFGYPTDCPQREKNGWTGDAHINIETGLYNFDTFSVYEKWMADHRDEQQENGVLPSIIPTWGGWGYDWGNGPDWTSTVAIIPWELYQFYGDDKVLKDMYDPIKKYVDHITSISDDDGLTDWGLGDWVPVKSKTPKEFTSSIYYYTDVLILSKAAKHLKREADFEKYSTLATRIKNSINKKYFNPETDLYGEGFQTELSAALFWGIVPDESRQQVADNLAKRVREDGKHIDVGLLGTRTILEALSDNGHADLAYEVASQTTFPSWGWWIQNGATTLYENWDIDASSDISRNHIMFGALSGWLYRGLGGIAPDENAPGFKNILLKPNFVEDLDVFKATHDGPNGKIVSKWTRNGKTITYTCEVPPNSTAALSLKGGEIAQLKGDKPVSGTSENQRQLLILNPGVYEFAITL